MVGFVHNHSHRPFVMGGIKTQTNLHYKIITANSLSFAHNLLIPPCLFLKARTLDFLI